jgi:hypothetical protein
MESRPTFWQRTKWGIWKAPHRPLITNDPRTYVTVEMHTAIGWRDRIGVLLLGRIRSTVLVYTDVEVKQAESRAVTWVE